MSTQVGTVRKPWTPEEDALLILLVSEHGSVGNWPTITLSMASRTGKQCRERYVNHLDPEMKKTAWTSDEDNVIRDMFPEFGTKWSQYMVLLPGRSDNSIKNRYHMVSRNNFECCSKVKEIISNKRSKHSNDLSFEDTDADSNTDLSSADVNRARLIKLLAARTVLDQEILSLENILTPNHTSPSPLSVSVPAHESSTPPDQTNAEIYSGFTDEPAGEQDGGFDFDSAWMDASPRTPVANNVTNIALKGW